LFFGKKRYKAGRRYWGKIIAAIIPPTTTIASGFWAWDPTEVAIAAGNSPRIAVKEIITTGRKSVIEPSWMTTSNDL
jgi:hypothetical protein